MLEKSYIDKICEYNIFDAHWYCTKYPDIKQGNLDPFKHFIQYGIYEKRFPNRNFRINLSELSNKLQNPVLEYIIYLCDNAISLSSICPLSNDKLKLLFDQATKLSLFNYNWYLEKYVDVYLTPNLHPFEHYMNMDGAKAEILLQHSIQKNIWRHIEIEKKLRTTLLNISLKWD